MHAQPQQQQNSKLKINIRCFTNLAPAAERVARQRIDKNGTDVQCDAQAGLESKSWCSL